MTSDASHRRRFDALFAAHRFDVASYCMWRTASRVDAEDAVAEVFLVAWNRIETIPSGDAARAWLYATARRVTANQRRSRRRRDALADRLARERRLAAPRTEPTSPEEAAVHAALARLGGRDREVLRLVEWEGLRAAELATVLGCREVTARGRLHRARRRFRAAFEAARRQDGASPSPSPPPRGNGSDSTRGRRPSAPDPAHIVHLTTRTALRKAQP